MLQAVVQPVAGYRPTSENKESSEVDTTWTDWIGL